MTRPAERYSPPVCRLARRCVVCGETTRERKPWCPKHVVTHSPYVARLMGAMWGPKRSKRKAEA